MNVLQPERSRPLKSGRHCSSARRSVAAMSTQGMTILGQRIASATVSPASPFAILNDAGSCGMVRA